MAKLKKTPQKSNERMDSALDQASQDPAGLKNLIPVFQTFANHGDVNPYQHYLEKVKMVCKPWEGQSQMAIIVPRLMEAYVHFCLGEYNTAESIIVEVSSEFDLEKDADHYALAESILGICKRDRGDIDAALVHCYKVTNILNKNNALANFKSYAFYFIAEIHMQIDDAEVAGKNYKKALKIARQVHHKTAIFRALIGLGRWYQHQNKPKKSIRLYKQALNMEAMSDTSISRVLRDIGTYYLSREKYEKSLRYLKKSYDVAMKCGYANPASTGLMNIAKVHLRTGRPQKALKALKEALQISLEHHTRAKQMEIEAMLADTYEALRDFKKAYKHSRKFQELREEMNTSKRRKIFEIKNQMIERQKQVIQEERDRSDRLLLNILPQSIASELKENDTVIPKRYEKTSVLFADFVGFTAISEKLTPERIVRTLDTYFRAFDNIVEQYGLEKIKTIGDAYMCAGGVPEPSERHAVDIAAAALDMQRFLNEVLTDLNKAPDEKWGLRIGIHSGPLVAGVVGAKKFQYDIWGDTVNTASRMESHGEVGEVNISQTTYELIKNDPQFEFDYRGKVEAKGKGEIDMWFVKMANVG